MKEYKNDCDDKKIPIASARKAANDIFNKNKRLRHIVLNITKNGKAYVYNAKRQNDNIVVTKSDKKLNKRKKIGGNAIYKFVDWVNENKNNLAWVYVCSNPHFLDVIDENENNIDMEGLSANSDPRAIEYIIKYKHKIDWQNISIISNLCSQHNSSTLEFILENARDNILNPNILLKRVILEDLLLNPFAKDVLSLVLPNLATNITYFPYHTIKYIKDKNLITFLINVAEDYHTNARLKQSLWDGLSTCPIAVDYLKHNIDKINWKTLCMNVHPDAINLIESQFASKSISFNDLSDFDLLENISAIQFVEKHIKEFRSGILHMLLRNRNSKARMLLFRCIGKSIEWQSAVSVISIMYESAYKELDYKPIINKFEKVWMNTKFNINDEQFRRIITGKLYMSHNQLEFLEMSVEEVYPIFKEYNSNDVLYKYKNRKVKDIIDWVDYSRYLSSIISKSKAKIPEHIIDIIKTYWSLFKWYQLFGKENMNVLESYELYIQYAAELPELQKNAVIYFMSSNPLMMHILKHKISEINWECLSWNPGIFEIDYNRTVSSKRETARKSGLLNNIVSKAQDFEYKYNTKRYHPDNMQNFADEIETLSHFGDHRLITNRANFSKQAALNPRTKTSSHSSLDRNKSSRTHRTKTTRRLDRTNTI